MHDFGFLAFDPGLLQFMKSGRIPLDPAAARVGLEVRVVGNDSGEKVRRDRPPSSPVPLRAQSHSVHKEAAFLIPPMPRSGLAPLLAGCGSSSFRRGSGLGPCLRGQRRSALPAVVPLPGAGYHVAIGTTACD